MPRYALRKTAKSYAGLDHWHRDQMGFNEYLAEIKTKSEAASGRGLEP
jgi:hypothetical protein